jgi:lysylphosphatidylglycerol synthetase-like protein (DUF2156 family)
MGEVEMKGSERRFGGLLHRDQALPSTSSSAPSRSLERTMAVRILVILAFAVAIYGWRHNHHLGLAVGLLIAGRAVWLGRPLTVGRFLASGFLLFIGFAAAFNGHQSVTAEAEIAAGAIVGLPRRAPGAASDNERMRVRAMVDATSGDTLAPFALRTDKSYAFSPDRTAALAYKVRFGTAVASGDPVGSPEAREAAITRSSPRASATAGAPRFWAPPRSSQTFGACAACAGCASAARSYSTSRPSA